LVEGVITRLTKFGAFARLDGDIEGLIHISEISENRIEHPKEELKEGEIVALRVIRIDPEQHRIGLSLRKVDSAAFADKDFKMLAREIDKLEEEESPAVEEEVDEPVAEESAEAEAPADVENDLPVEPPTEEPVVAEAVESPDEPPAEMPLAEEEPEAEKSTETSTEPEA
jgi:small subunit ribosomal protein S1